MPRTVCHKERAVGWLVAAVAIVGGCVSPPDDVGHAAATRGSHALSIDRAALQHLLDPADLRDEARRVIARLRAGHLVTAPPPLDLFGQVSLPPTVRVWRRSRGGSDSCSGQVDEIELERYVKGVLPHEWIVSWEVESLRAGAVAIRSYASCWVIRGGKYDCADVCDTTYTQVYKDGTDPKTDQAVDATRGQVVLDAEGAIVFAEYSAENGDPTKTGVSDPVCAGKQVAGHGRGMCQWGTQRWASQQGKDYRWMALHYYPGSTLHDPASLPADAAAPAPDAGSAADGAAIDSSGGAVDSGAPFDFDSTLIGGCSVGQPGAAPPLWLLLLVALCSRRAAR